MLCFDKHRSAKAWFSKTEISEPWSSRCIPCGVIQRVSIDLQKLLDNGQHGSWVRSPDSYLQTAQRRVGRGVHTSNVSTEEDHRLFLAKIRLDYGAWAATAAMSAMLSPFLRDGTALMCKMTPETGARASSISLPK